MSTPFDHEQTIPEGEHPLLSGRYRVVRRLGAGGMGEVHLVEDLKLDGRHFAVKLLPAFLAANKRAIAGLKREALHAMNLSHPHIVTVRGFEEMDTGQPFLVMDYVDGQTLEEILLERERMSEAEVLRIFGPIAEALDYAHGRGVIHRDVKPSNIMIRQDGTPLIMDFGIAREAKETSTLVTGRESTSGTLPYMSPEQLRGKKPEASQDIYSLAATMWECLAGEPPFSRGDLRHQIETVEPDPPSELDGIEFADSLIRGLSKAPEDRPGSCGALLGETKPVPAGQRAAPSPTTSKSPGKKPRSGADLLDLESKVRILAREAKTALEDGESLPPEYTANFERAGHFVESAKENKSARLWSDASTALERAADLYEDVKAARVAMRNEAERLESERLKSERLDMKRIEAAGLEAARLETARLEAIRIDTEARLARLAREHQAKRSNLGRISAGGNHTIAVLPDGSVACWGKYWIRRYIAPRDIGTREHPVTQVATSDEHSVVVKSDGSVACWGSNVSGQCDVPSDVGTPANPVASVAAGNFHTVALLADGSVACWGSKNNRQCDVPSDVGTPANPVVSLAAGGVHTVALLADGSVACWGLNRSGQCNVPTGVGTPANPVVSVAAGIAHTAVLLADGSVACWGSNRDGQCNVPSGVGTPVNPVVSGAAGSVHTVALLADGSVACWGDNCSGQCNVPSDVGTPANPVVSVAAGFGHTVAVRSDGSIRCWGQNSSRQCTPPADLRVRLPE